MRKFFVLLLVVALAALLAVPTFAQERPNIPTLLTEDADGRFTTLLAAVEAAGLGEALSGEGPFTVFAPTNDAFAAALEQLGLTVEDVVADTDLLTAILTYHVVPERLFFRNLAGGGELETLQGGTVTAALADGVFSVNNVTILDVDNVASNGVVHVLEDGVLLPPLEALMANVRVAHFSPDAPAVDVWVNGAMTLENVEFGAISDWLMVPAGVYDVAVAPTGTEDVVLSLDNAFIAPGSNLTAAAIGSVAGETLALQVIPEDFSSVTADTAQVTVFHAIEGAPAVNVTADGNVVISNLAFPGTDGDNDGVFSLDVPAGTYDLAVVAGGAALLEAPATELMGGMSYFIAAIGTPDAPELAVAATEVPAAE